MTEDPKRIEIRQRHIEQDRRWREIGLADVRRALISGEAISIRSSDKTLFWQGKDTQGRTLELLCSLVTQNGKDTLVIKEAHTIRVGTAYEPGKEDEVLKKKWLNAHPEYELGPLGKVVRKITILK